jgi:hypothetical protein
MGQTASGEQPLTTLTPSETRPGSEDSCAPGAVSAPKGPSVPPWSPL